MRNFLWAGVNTQGLRAKVKWGEFCIHHLRGLGLIAPKEGLVALPCKWVLKALELMDLNLKVMLQYSLRSLTCNSSKHAMWILHLNWALVYNHVSPFGKYKIWWSLMKAWKQGITNTLALPIDKMLYIYLLCPHSEH